MSLEDHKLQLYKLLQERRRRELEDSLHEFTKDAFQILHNHQKLLDNWHIKFLCSRIQREIERIAAKEPRNKHLIINVPPRSLKSEILICASAWAWIKDPSIKIIGSSYAKDLSIDHNVMARRLIESEFYQTRWGSRVVITTDVNNKSKFDNMQDGFRTCTSTGGAITGKGGDIIIVDDPLNPKLAASALKRKAANDFFNQTLRTRLNDPEVGIYIVIMQRLHEDDLTGHLLNRDPENWDLIVIPAEKSKDVKPKTLASKYDEDGLFFPRRFTVKYLNEMRKGLGSYGYACQFLQRAAPEEGGMIKKSWFGRFNLMDLERLASDAEASLIWNYKIDGAFTSKETNDATAIMAYAWLGNYLYVRNVISVRMELPELVKFIPEFCRRTGYDRSSMVKIEPKGPGLSVAQALERHTDLNITTDKAPATDKIARVSAITPFLESNRCRLMKNEPWIDGFLNQVGSFPNARHDDEVDVLVMAINDVEDPKGAISSWGVIG